MDWIRQNWRMCLQKYRYVLVVFLTGVFLMTLPQKKPTEELPQEQTQTVPTNLESELSELLSRLSGAGKVQVLLTQAAGEQRIYQTDESQDIGQQTRDIRRETVLVSGSGHEETGLICRIDPPVYQGAIILCQGADKAQVRLSIVEAVANVTGLSTDKITVLKMK